MCPKYRKYRLDNLFQKVVNKILDLKEILHNWKCISKKYFAKIVVDAIKLVIKYKIF